MDQSLLFGVVALLLLLVGLPLALSVSERNREKHLAQPIVIFTSYGWKFKREVLLTLFLAALGLFLASIGGMIPIWSIARAFIYKANSSADVVIIVNMVGLALLTAGIVMITPAILYWNYRRTLGRVSIIFRRAEQVLEYTSKNSSTRIAAAEVKQLIYNHTWQFRENIGYTMLVLATGRQLPVPTALCDFADLRALLPVSEIEMISDWLPVLPSCPTIPYYKR